MNVPPVLLDIPCSGLVTMTIAFSSKHPYVPNPNSDPQSSRWIASLSDGTTVFEDVTPGMVSAWVRLKEYVNVHKLKITNLRLEAYGHRVTLVPYKDEFGCAQINGYWHSKQIGALMNGAGISEQQSRGIGYVKADVIYITWIDESGNIRQEVRPYIKDTLAVIINDPPF